MPLVHRRSTVELRDMRLGAAPMLAAAAVRPLLPGQPGLPCPLRSLTGIPCPLCGATRSVTAAVHLHLGQAFHWNPVGIVAVVAAVALLVTRVKCVTIPAWAPPVAVAALWAWQLWRFPSG
ncbi:MAG TPA: DUF2752 domain-containing protein [Acidimicrobiales bacterium]|nr:DUF2752 domain-containing protein [Acidimicrobiales bacterium]